MSPRYRRDIVERLAAHGIVPTETTPPQRVHDFVTDLYRYELRRLRERLLRKEIAKPDYYAQVVQIRNRYPVLSMKVSQWVE